MRRPVTILLPLLALALFSASGCAVPQPRGEGLYQYITEPTTGAGYHLYLPKDYVKNNGRHPNPRIKRWPLVMTFHGMKPYDNALPQEREWEKEADTYGYIVCAPELRTSDSFMEYPLTREHSYVLDDKRNVIAIMDHVVGTTLADPKKVLSTSWSCGGYLAHYFPNRFPERFSCIATRLSNFSPQLLIDETVPRYRDRTPVAIFIGDGDFAACKTESEEAVAWYTARGFKVRGKMIDNMGHSRIPQTAAAFFAETLRMDPLHPKEAAATVALVQMTEYFPPQELIARVAPPISLAMAPSRGPSSPRSSPPSAPTRSSVDRPRGERVPAVPLAATTPQNRRDSGYSNQSAGRDYPINRPPAGTSKTQTPSEKPAEERYASATDSGRNNVNRSSAAPTERSRPAVEPRAPASPPRDPAPREPSPRDPAARQRSVPSEPNHRTLAQGSQRGATPAQQRADDSPPPRQTPFTPSDAGRQYGSLKGANVPPSASNATARRSAADVQLAASERAPVEPVSEPRPGNTDRVRNVKIKLSGPNIGSSPLYLAYSVDLPRDVLTGADLLWMDNGVWIGNEPRGVKILESPGMHHISVQVITRDNIEYRGKAVVQVLDRGPTAAAN